MIRETVLFIFVLLSTVITNAQTFKTLRGDVNGDGVVNGTDIQAVINFIVTSEYDEKADVNSDGVVIQMKFRFLFLIIVLLFAVATDVCATENISEDFPQYKLFVWMKNGEKTGYLSTDKPEILFHCF